MNGDEAADSPVAGRASAPRLVLRLLAGGAALGTERLVLALRILDELRDPVIPDPRGSPSARHVALGALAEAPRWVGARLAAGTHRLRGLGRRAARMARPLQRLPYATRLVGRAGHRYARLRGRAAARFAHLAAIGRYEEARARQLASAALAAAVEIAAARLADSPDVRRLLEEQSEGLAASAVSELRDQTARADRLAESVVWRVLRRSPERDR
jgi:hypothetical protein